MCAFVVVVVDVVFVVVDFVMLLFLSVKLS